MVTLGQSYQLSSTVVDHWWQYTRREHRLFLRLINEKPEHLLQLPYLEIIITNIDRTRVQTLRSEYPKVALDARRYLLSSERSFLDCLRAVRHNNLVEANMHYNKSLNDLSLLQYIFMTSGIQSNI